MADTKISAMPAASALGGTEQFAAVQGGSNVKITTTQIQDFIEAANNAFTGINSWTGASVITPTAMPALAVDVTKAWNTKSITGDVTFTYSNATPTDGTETVVSVTTDGTQRTVTIPSTYSLARGAAITSLVIPASYTLKFRLTYNAALTRWEIIGDPVPSTGTGAYVKETSPTFVNSFILASGAAPTTAVAAEMAFDTNAWAASRGAAQLFDGTANTYLIGVLASSTPSNGQVPQWNTGGTITWVTPAGGGNVSNTGTPVDNQLAIWTNSTTIEGVAGLTYGATANTLIQTTDALAGVAAGGIAVANTTAAVNGTQQVSPLIRWEALGFGTTAGTSQRVAFQAYVSPTQSTVPTGTLLIQAAIAGAAMANVASFSNNGTFTAVGGLVAGTSVTATTFFTGTFYRSATQSLSGPGAANVTQGATAITTTGTNDAITLADGAEGQEKVIFHAVDGGSFVLTPTTKTGWSTFTSTVAGECISLRFTATRGWIITGSFGGTIA